jgi:superfamily II DNA or RNA helicase
VSNSLRPYQRELLDKTRAALAAGKRAPCIVAPCGAGKSVIVAEIARCATAKRNRVLFLVHRRELCGQIERTFARWGVDMFYCYVGMVQTVVRRIDRMPPPSLIITDENHHSSAASYKKIYAAFANVPRVGVTATPIRLDGSGLGDVNDALIEGVDTKWLIENGYLAPFDYYAPPIADLTGLTVARGEFVTADIMNRMDKATVYGDAITNYKNLADGRKAICYCASVAHSKRMAQMFREAGIPSAHIDGETPSPVRDRLIQLFRDGEIRVLCNVDLISEGFDVPDCGASILLRPTQSLTLYIQQSMRCMRPAPGKRAIIIDHAGNYARFGLPDEPRKWDLTAKKKSKGEAALNVRQCPQCYFTHGKAPKCPKCGFVYQVKSRQLAEAAGTLQRIDGFKLDTRSPEECATYGELAALGRARGYKPGWAYFQARERGYI